MTVQEMRFKIITEDGENNLLLTEYHTKDALCEKIGLITAPSEKRMTVFAGTTIVSYPYSILDVDPKKKKLMEELDNMVQKNPFKYFIPQSESVRMFLNDTDHNLKGLVAPNGTGKAQPLDTRIPTPTGWTTMGQLSVGDTVFSRDGKQCKVTGVFDRGVLPVYRINLDRGKASVLASGDHLWWYLSHSRAFKHNENAKHKNSTVGKFEVFTTDQIIKHQGSKASSQKRGYIPICKAVEMAEVPLVIKPYTMGVILGDGSMKMCGITSDDPEVIDIVRSELPYGSEINKNSSKYAYGIKGTIRVLGDKKNGRRVPHFLNPVRIALKIYGLEDCNSYSKFIPNDYMLASVEQRKMLLRGLMDTDGTCDRTTCDFTTCSDVMAKQVVDLVHSLGGKCNSRKRTTRDQNGTECVSNRVTIWTDFNPFRMRWKAEKWRQTPLNMDRLVCDIEYVGEMPCRCISVDSSDSSYLTDNFLVTHNSTAGWVDVLLDIIPCDPSWPIFTSSGINHRRYRGARTLGGVGIVSYEWANHISTIWPQIVRRWTPNDCLGDWASGGSGTINWKNNPRMDICGTPICFLACSQAQTVFESSAMDIYWWDEQGEEDKFNGANMRIRRRNGRHVFTLTPHRLPGRPDTGAGSWIHKMYSGENTCGLNPQFYHIDLADIPDWVYSQKAKKDATDEWINEPTRTGNIKKLREGRSRIFGEFHESSGLVFDEWDRRIHCIQPFDIPSDWTKYRGIDHGRVEPTACLWAAVNPDGDVFVYREYYEKDRVVSENAEEIIKASGNLRTMIDRPFNQKGEFYEVYDEIETKEKFMRTVLDSRSFGKRTDESQFTIGQIYRNNGLRAWPANGNTPSLMVNTVKEYLKIDQTRKHHVSGLPGAPRMYFFDNLKWTIWEVEQYINEITTRKDRYGNTSTAERPRAKDDHLMSALMFLCMEKLVYLSPDFWNGVDSEGNSGVLQTRDPITGY